MQIEINGNKVNLNLTTTEAITLVQRIVVNLPASSGEIPLYIASMGCILENNGENYPSKCVVTIVD